MKTPRLVAAAMLFVGSGLTLQLVQAQQQTNQVMQSSGIGRTDVLQNDLNHPGREVIQTRVDFPPGATAAAHTHPGEEVAYILEGTLEYNLEGRPPITLKAGEACSFRRERPIGYGTSAVAKRRNSPRTWSRRESRSSHSSERCG
jgi:quercetin dioxygenase-like cupin family protein